MPIDPDGVGTAGAAGEATWSSRDAMLYALGVGAGPDELAFTTENTAGSPQRVLPTMAVILSMGGGDVLGRLGDFDRGMVVHGAQAIELYGEIPVSGAVTNVPTVIGIHDKGSGALVVVETVSTDVRTGSPLFKSTNTLFIRGEGGWGGDRGPAAEPGPPERSPDHSVTYQTRPEQALLYRLSGDRNRLHSDPAHASRVGFDRPILHGLCTFGFAGRALLHTLCNSDPGRFGSMSARFAKPVLPGESLTVDIWLEESGVATFITRGEDGRVVIDSGRFGQR